MEMDEMDIRTGSVSIDEILDIRNIKNIGKLGDIIDQSKSIALRKFIDDNIDIVKEYTSLDCWPNIMNPIDEPLWFLIATQLAEIAVDKKNPLRKKLFQLAMAANFIGNHIHNN